MGLRGSIGGNTPTDNTFYVSCLSPTLSSAQGTSMLFLLRSLLADFSTLERSLWSVYYNASLFVVTWFLCAAGLRAAWYFTGA